MKRVGRVAYWLVLNLVLFALAWFGYAEEVDGARRVFLFLVGVFTFAAFLANSDKGRAELQARGPRVPLGLTAAVDFVLAIGLVWFGGVGAAVLVVLYLLLTITAYAAPAKAAE